MEIYHLINRGVEKRDVFKEDGDYLRFVHDMYVFNDAQSAPNYITKERAAGRIRKLLVRIHAFALMPNHYHILASPLHEDALSLFMRKLNMGYAKYFNEKYERSGVLWQGTFRKISVKRNAHFMHIPYYIHLNPLDLTHPNWRRGAVRDWKAALASLERYRWSSFPDYAGVRNFPSVLHMHDLRETLGSRANQVAEMKSIVSSPNLSEASAQLELD